MKRTKIRITFIEPCLGTLPGDPQIYKEYIATKNPNRTSELVEAEVNSLVNDEETEEFEGRPVTTFARMTLEDGTRVPAINGYVLKGMFKNACSALRDCEDTLSSTVTAYNKKIDQLVFVNMDRANPLSRINLVDDSILVNGILPICERPLRASTPQGERVAISCSEEVPAGSTVEFEIAALNDTMFALVFEWLDYGMFNGLGCWHNSGKGRFSYEVLDGDPRPDYVGAAVQAKKRGRKKKEETTEVAE